MESDREIREIQKAIEDVWAVGQRLGLDAFPTHFEIVPAAIMYEFGAYGLPGRFSHWTHGKAFHQMKTLYDYGLSKIYELVVNTNPCYAFLLEGNSLIQNKLVIAHVMAHSDFFKNNVWFANTRRDMIEAVSANAKRIDRYCFEHGPLEVEKFLDAVLAVQEHVDFHTHIRRAFEEQEQGTPAEPRRSTPYDDLWRLEDRHREPEPPRPKRFPPEPDKDVLRFIAENSPVLEEWQRDCLWIVREEMLYFCPQLQTKVMNEGWATYWHARVLRELDLDEKEYVEFANLHAAVLSPQPSRRQINPYLVGLRIWEDIQRRWDEPTEEERRVFGRPGGQGMQKLFEVRELENDVSFLRNYLTKELVEELDLYIYRREGDQWVVVEKDWERVRDTLVHQMTNMGFPYICVEDGDYRGNRELYLKHYYEDRELDLVHAKHALRHVYTLWGRPVHLETVVDGQPVLFSFDGSTDTVTHLG
ncbi:MAG: SpoVR family protein [Armatimonadota bacterium]